MRPTTALAVEQAIVHVCREAQLARRAEKDDFESALRLFEKAQAIVRKYADGNCVKVGNVGLKRQAPDPGAVLLHGAVDYLYGEAQSARSENEKEDFSISLRLLALLCEDRPGGPGLFDAACGYAVGLPHAKYLYRRAARATFLLQQYHLLIPDWDYSHDRPPEDETDGRRRYYGNRFRDMAGQAVPRVNPEATCGTNEDIATASRRPGTRTNPDARHAEASFTGATDLAGGVVEDRGGAPKRIDSALQRAMSLARKAANKRTAEQMSFYGS